MASVIAFDVNETLLDLHALDEPFEVLLGSASLRPQWFMLMLQLAFTGGLTGQYVDFTTAQRAALAMAAGCQAAFVARPGMVLSPLGDPPGITGPNLAAVAEQIITIDG